MTPYGRFFRHIAAAAVLAGLCACGSKPTSPSGGTLSVATAMALTCPDTLIVGQTLTCTALATLRAGGVQLVNFGAVWTTSASNIAEIAPLGGIKGKGVGTVTISAAFGGQTGNAQVNVVSQDALGVTASADQGTFSAGQTVIMFVQGFYDVASAPNGQLSMKITDQNGATVATNTPVTVAGGDGFTINTTFTIPSGATQVCRQAVLVIGGTTLTAVPANDTDKCHAVQ